MITNTLKILKGMETRVYFEKPNTQTNLII